MKKPNIILTIADDQRGSALGCEPFESVLTPHLDALTRRGTRFDHAYHFGSPHGAVCAPSRAMLHTGLPHHQLDAALLGPTYPSNARSLHLPPTLGQKLRHAGYHTFATGKWHNGIDSFRQSFSAGDNLFFGGMADHYFTPVHSFDPTGRYPQSAAHTASGFSTEVFARTAVDFIRSRADSDQPFFCYCAFTSPHDPRTPPDAFRRMYDPRDQKLPPNYRAHPIFNTAALFTRDEELLGIPREKNAILRSQAEYFAMITHMDHCIGQIHDALAASGHLDNTLVIHTADHGLAVGQHGLLGKQNMYDHSTRVPLIIAGPDIPAGRLNTSLCYQHDLHPTLLELARADTSGVFFQSLLPMMTDASQGRDHIVSHYRHDQCMVRDENFKLIEYRQPHRLELYDLRNDPWETHDLSTDPQYAPHLARLKELLTDPQLQANMGALQV